MADDYGYSYRIERHVWDEYRSLPPDLREEFLATLSEDDVVALCRIAERETGDPENVLHPPPRLRIVPDDC